MADKREKFLRVYANIPPPLRKDIIVIVDGKTYTWNTAYLEIKDKTKLGEEILKSLEFIGLI